MSTLRAINIQHPSSPSNNIVLDNLGNVIVPGTVDMGTSFLRNRLINGGMAIDQRNSGASQTITAGAALAYTVDRWYAYCTGANVTGQRVAGDVANTFRYRFTGAASVTAIGFGQRIEALNSADLAGKTATLSVNISNSLLTTVTWTAFYANTSDTFGTLASPTRTQIATGTFTVNSSFNTYSAQINIPAAATTGIEIVFTVGAQTSGTWLIGNIQLEESTIVTPFERRSFGQELTLCQRYYQTSYFGSGVSVGSATTANCILYTVWTNTNYSYTTVYFVTSMRIIPTVVSYSVINGVSGVQYNLSNGNQTTAITSYIYGFINQINNVAAAAGQNYQFHWAASAEL